MISIVIFPEYKMDKKEHECDFCEKVFSGCWYEYNIKEQGPCIICSKCNDNVASYIQLVDRNKILEDYICFVIPQTKTKLKENDIEFLNNLNDFKYRQNVMFGAYPSDKEFGSKQTEWFEDFDKMTNELTLCMFEYFGLTNDDLVILAKN